MTGIRAIIEHAVAAYIAEHPKHFSERGLEKAQAGLSRKIMSALFRADGDKPAEAAAPEPPVELQPLPVDPVSREGRAYSNLRMLAGAAQPFRMADGKISVPTTAQRESVYALADLPKQDAWVFITEKPQLAAWLGFFSETLPTAARQRIEQVRGGAAGILMPWPWPPSATGKIYTAEESE